jgi:hypothetical protein
VSADITPEGIAEHLIGGEMHIGRCFAGYVDVACEGAVLRIGFTPKGKPSQIENFCAVVVRGETVPDPTEADRLKARLEAAEAIMRQCLAAVEHAEVAHLLGLYFDAAARAAEAERAGGQ